MERVSCTKFLGVRTSPGQPTLHHWRRKPSGASTSSASSRERKLPNPILNAFYRGTIESILSSCITVWGSSCTEHSRKALQRIVNTAGKSIVPPLPSLQDIYTPRLTRKATSIASDTSHPAHSLFSLL